MPAGKSLKCPKCDRAFAFPMHLARHMKSAHGVKGAKRKAAKGKPGRPPGKRKVATTRTGLGELSFEQLHHLIEAASAEALRRLESLHATFG